MTVRTKGMFAEMYSSKERIIDTSQSSFRGKKSDEKRNSSDDAAAPAGPSRYMAWNGRGLEGLHPGTGV